MVKGIVLTVSSASNLDEEEDSPCRDVFVGNDVSNSSIANTSSQG